MPLSPVTALLFDVNYVMQQYPVLGQRLVNAPIVPPLCADNPSKY
jgi:hypothetical protein